MTHLFELLYIIGGTYANPFDTNTCTGTKRPSVRITESAECNRYLARERKGSRQLIGCGEGRTKATYLL